MYCAVVLDAWSCRVVGWSIDSTPGTALVTNALGMAIEQRRPHGDTVIHSDQGTKFAHGVGETLAAHDHVLTGVAGTRLRY